MRALIENKKARLEHEILETYEAGLSLHGFEVKSLRNGQGSLVGSRVLVRGGEAYLVGLQSRHTRKRTRPKATTPSDPENSF